MGRGPPRATLHAMQLPYAMRFRSQTRWRRAPGILARQEEDPAQRRQPVERIHRSGARAVAIGPVVVARGEQQRRVDRGEIGPDPPVGRLAARARAVLDVADVDDQRRRLPVDRGDQALEPWRSEEHTSELQSLMRISYAVFCFKK